MAQPYDDDDDDLRRAIAMSLEDAESSAIYDSTPQVPMEATVNGKAVNTASQLHSLKLIKLRFLLTWNHPNRRLYDGTTTRRPVLRA